MIYKYSFSIIDCWDEIYRKNHSRNMEYAQNIIEMHNCRVRLLDFGIRKLSTRIAITKKLPTITVLLEMKDKPFFQMRFSIKTTQFIVLITICIYFSENNVIYTIFIIFLLLFLCFFYVKMLK